MTRPESGPIVTGLSEDEHRAVETLYRAFGAADPDLLDAAVTADWQDIPLAPQQKPGRDGMKPLIREFAEAFPNLKVSLFEIIGHSGHVAVRGLLSGTHRGEWFGIAPTGRPFQMPIHDFHHITDGRITHTWHQEDWFGWLCQVGAWPAGGREAA